LFQSHLFSGRSQMCSKSMPTPSKPSWSRLAAWRMGHRAASISGYPTPGWTVESIDGGIKN
jgi:hypothetical protein